jgi:hypothetical protein
LLSSALVGAPLSDLPDAPLLTALALCAFAFVSGFVDAVAGGGGLIQLPALLILLPGVPIPTIIGTNKLAAIFGTATASMRYGRRITLPWRTALPAAATAFGGAALGSRLVHLLNPAVARPLVLALLVVVALFTLLRPDYGTHHAPHRSGTTEWLLAMAVGGGLGFYDGFFGPGAGSFLIFAFIGLFGFDFLTASATAKVVNFGSNLASVIYFTATRNVRYGIGLAMGASFMAGAALGAGVALDRGTRLVRPFFLTVVTLLILRIAWDTVRL